ncbi:MAG TPA: NAD(P)/FAD-dependent oxidoreductase [Kofleriaceae bacterium]|nr:NAD(P)/FAD-dependent oxidoreductase [Kofleriaceae bacterium]
MTAPERTRVAIIGTGFSGLAMAIQLERSGRADFLLLERSDTLGGTWRDNHYPGCACDVPAHLYSFSFAPNPDWSSAYAPQPEIRAYVERCAARYRLADRIRYGADVTTARLDEARAEWTITTADGRVFVADAVVAAVGGLSRPMVPRLPGLERFAGRTWHSAAWDHDAPLDGKTVAVVGTGASAIQFVPRIAPRVARLALFQRTPPWVLPREDHEFTDAEKRRFRRGPVRWLHRQRLYWSHEARSIPFTLEPRLLHLAQRIAIRHIQRQVRDPELARRLTPSYVMGCKRILLSNDYYPAVARPNVELVTEPIREVTARGLVTADGALHAVDAIVFGTGFDVHDYLGPIRVIGRGGEDLSERWRRRAEAHLGTTVPGFPNFFTLIGPNTGLGHNSIIFMAECQVRYILSCLRAMERRGVCLVEPRAEVTRRYNERLQGRLRRTVWTSGCKSWYLNQDGVNTTLWPGSTAEFMLRTWRFDPADHVMVRRDELPAAAPARAPLVAVRGGVA